MNLVNREAQGEERRRQHAMTIIECLEGEIGELKEGLAAAEGARILLRHAYEIAEGYAAGEEAALCYAENQNKIEHKLKELERVLTWKVQKREEDLKDPLHEKKAHEPTGKAAGLEVKIIEQYNDPGVIRMKCTECGNEMKIATDCDVANIVDGEIESYTFCLDFECPVCGNDCSVPMYKWRWER